MSELKKLSKQDLLKQARSLQTKLAMSSDTGNSEYLLHNLQVHQIELEMKNRELHEVQQQLVEARNLYADLYDFATLCYMTLDDKGIIKNINLTGASLLGTVRMHILSHPFSRWVVNSDVELFFSHLRTVLMSDVRISNEISLRSSSGDMLDVRIDSIRSLDTASNTFVCRSILLDVTEYNLTRNELLLQERQLRLITDALPVLIAYIDEYEQHQFANKMYRDWFGLTSERLDGKQVSEVWGNDNYLKIGSHLKISLSGRRVSFDVELLMNENIVKSVNIDYIPDFDKAYHLCGVIIVITDITDRLMLENIDRKRLVDAAHISRLSSMGEMSSEIAHELNQPLAAISIYSDACRRMLLSGKADQDSILKSLSDITAQSERAAEVLRRIREFTSKKELSYIETSINTLVEDAVQLLAVEFRLHNVQMKLELEKNIPLIHVDKILLEQVIFNLVHNAIEAMEDVDKSQRLLRIHTSVCAGYEVEIRIEDSGPGLSEENIKKIFSPFYSTKVDGVGLGLAISKSVVEAHRGRLWVVSNPSTGSIFSITIPIENPGENSAT